MTDALTDSVFSGDDYDDDPTFEVPDKAEFEERPPYVDEGPDERPPAKHEKRTSTANLVSLAWGGVGTALIQSQADVPVGRVLLFQAPLAGVKFDELIAHTWLDALLQPLAKQGDKMEGFGALIALPLLVGLVERNNEAYPVVEPMLRAVLRSTLSDIAPMLKKQKADDMKAAKAVAEMSDVLDLQKGDDPIEAILEMIFTPPGGPAEPEPNGE